MMLMGRLSHKVAAVFPILYVTAHVCGMVSSALILMDEKLKQVPLSTDGQFFVVFYVQCIVHDADFYILCIDQDPLL